MKRKQHGFTLIELLIVVAIIGILAAIAIPNLLQAMQRSRQKRTVADMRTIATAWEARATDINSYQAAGAAVTWPATTAGVSTLQAILAPTYVKSVPHYDGWSTEFRIGSNTASYAVESYGADKTNDSESEDSGPIVTSKFDCDIIFSDGTFVKYPEGVQTQ